MQKRLNDIWHQVGARLLGSTRDGSTSHYTALQIAQHRLHSALGLLEIGQPTTERQRYSTLVLNDVLFGHLARLIANKHALYRGRNLD